jgi:predicted nucleic acid-binding protein
LILTIDTFAWIEIIRGSPLGKRAKDLLEGSDRCITPSIVLAEVASKRVSDGASDLAIRNELTAIREASEVFPISETVAMLGARATVELRQAAQSARLQIPGLADGLVLATARVAHSKLLTGDPHFRSLPETLWLS